MIDPIPYTHWSYFRDRDAAETCGNELDLRFECLIDIREAVGAGEDGPEPWLLLAGRTVDVDGVSDWYSDVQAVVERHGGNYDFGEAGWSMFGPPRPGAAVETP